MSIKPIDTERFGKILCMLVSSTDNASKLVALGRANAMLNAAGLRWDDVARHFHSGIEHQKTITRKTAPDRSSTTTSKHDEPIKVHPQAAAEFVTNEKIPSRLSGKIRIINQQWINQKEVLTIYVIGSERQIYGPIAIFDHASIKKIHQRNAENINHIFHGRIHMEFGKDKKTAVMTLFINNC